MEALIQAINEVNIQRIKLLLSYPNAKQIVNQVDGDIYHSLFHASKILNEDISLQVINMLLEKGANPYHKQENRQNILFYLAKEGKAKIIQKLLQTYKYDLNDPDKYNQNPLYWAAKLGRLKVAQLLLRYGVKINHLDDNGQTCLFFAAAEGHLQMCKFLINRGCQHDHVDKLKKTPLYFAKMHKHHAVSQYLTSLKEPRKTMIKEIKEKEISVSIEQKKKKKEIIRNQYVFVYTNEQGNVHEMAPQEIEEFKKNSQANSQIYEYMYRPQLLERVQARHEKKFIRVATKIITNYLKRPDLSLFALPVDINIYCDYPDHVDRPMDFTTIKTKLAFNCYQSEDEFKSDVLLVYDNCIRYNGNQSALGTLSKKLKFQFIETFQKESFSL